jgi:hypothetical protein
MKAVRGLVFVILATGCGRSTLGGVGDIPDGGNVDGGLVDIAVVGDMPFNFDLPRPFDMRRDGFQPDLARRDGFGFPDLRQPDLAFNLDGFFNFDFGQPDLAFNFDQGIPDFGINFDISVQTDLALPSDLAGCNLNCNDGNPCTVDFCDAAGVCRHQNAPNGTTCSDGNACTGPDRCFNGTCSALGTINCNDGNTCTIDSCNPFTGCVFTPRPNGSFCFDGDLCTTNDQCLAGVCIGTQRNCDDNNPCTLDGCGAFGNCTHLPQTGNSCNDRNPCTTNDTCNGGNCLGSPVTDGTRCGPMNAGCCAVGLCCVGPGCCP